MTVPEQRSDVPTTTIDLSNPTDPIWQTAVAQPSRPSLSTKLALVPAVVIVVLAGLTQLATPATSLVLAMAGICLVVALSYVDVADPRHRVAVIGAVTATALTAAVLALPPVRHGVDGTVEASGAASSSAFVAELRRTRDLRGRDLRGRDLDGIDLRGHLMARADLRGASLRGAVLAGVNLRGALAGGADLSGADLSTSCLVGVDLTSATTAGAVTEGAITVLPVVTPPVASPVAASAAAAAAAPGPAAPTAGPSAAPSVQGACAAG